MLKRAACLPVIVFVFSTLIVGPVYGATVEEFGIRITKDVTPTSVCPGDDVTVTLRIESTDQAQAVPVDVVIALDRSLSMQGEKLQDAKNAAKQFVDQLSVPEDQVALVSFSDTATLDKGLSTDVAGVKAAIDGMTAGNLTAIGEAINVARAEALGPSHRDFNVPTIVLLSDGQNTAGVDPGQPAEAAKNAGVRIISIGLGGGVDEAALTSAASSESDYYFAPTSTVLSAIYADIVQSFEALVTTNAAVVDVVPGHATYVQGSASRPPDVGGKTLTWDIGTLDSAEAWVVNWRQTMAAEGLVDDLTSRFNFTAGDRQTRSVPLPQVSVTAKNDCETVVESQAPPAIVPPAPAAQPVVQAQAAPAAAPAPAVARAPLTGTDILGLGILATIFLGGGLMVRRVLRKDS